jgi:hypothetical protein
MAARVMQTDDRNFLKFFEWSHLILDEAHLVKNAASARSKKIRVMAKRCQRRLLLTVQTPFPPCCSRCKPPSPPAAHGANPLPPSVYPQRRSRSPS